MHSFAQTQAQAKSSVVVTAAAADRKLWAPGVVAPSYLDGSLPGDYGWDPLGLGSNPKALTWYQQAELQNGRWAMLGVAGVLAQEIAKPDVFFYESAVYSSKNLPFGMNMGSLLAINFLLMHWVEVRRWQDIRKFGSVNKDPIFGYEVPNAEMGYPGGPFNPLGFGKDNMKEMQTKEIKNARLAMIAFMAFIVQAQATGENPLAALKAHLANPLGENILTNLGKCVIPATSEVAGIVIPTPCLWPGQ